MKYTVDIHAEITINDLEIDVEAFDNADMAEQAIKEFRQHIMDFKPGKYCKVDFANPHLENWNSH